MKNVLAWIVRIFEDSAGVPSSKRIFGAVLVVSGVCLAFMGGDSVTVGILLGAGLGMFGVSSWGK